MRAQLATACRAAAAAAAAAPSSSVRAILPKQSFANPFFGSGSNNNRTQRGFSILTDAAVRPTE
jgi:hypothetical protein